MSNFWNERFAEPGYKYGTAPNAFLRERWPALHARLSPAAPAPLRVLVPGDGEGRNGVWLAAQGAQVLAVDSAEVGLQKARALAERSGPEEAARYRTEVADLATWAPEPGAWDAVVLIYTHLPGAIRRTAHQRLATGLRPGGVLLLEAFHPQQLGRTSGGPKDVDMLYRLAQLREDFSGLLDETLGWEGETLLDEGPGHQGAGYVTRWMGVRPARQG